MVVAHSRLTIIPRKRRLVSMLFGRVLLAS